MGAQCPDETNVGRLAIGAAQQIWPHLLLDQDRGTAEYKPKPDQPKIWFTSMKSVAEVLSDQNRALLKVIRETNPDSMAVLAKITGRQPSNLSRTLKTMSRYGLVDLQREKTHVRPVVKATEFRILAAA